MIMKLQSYKDLVVWQKSVLLVKEVYVLTAALPREELYGLTSQVRRSAISIPSNIAEGYRRQGRNEYLHFLSIANASAAELETQLILVQELYPTAVCIQCLKLLEEVQKMLMSMIRKLRTSKP